MTALIYLLIFLTSTLLSLILTRLVRDFASVHGWVSKPSAERHIHKKSIPRLGGVAICAAFVFVTLLAMTLHGTWRLCVSLRPAGIASVCAALLIIFALGLYDDIRGVGPYAKFAIEAAAACLLYAGGIGVQRLDLYSAGHALRTLTALPLTIIWVLLITNAFNLIDGLDGLAAGSAFFSTIVLFVMSLLVPHSAVAMLTIVLAGVILGFLPYNFYPASIFLGDSGSLFIGFLLATLALAGSEKAPIMIAVAIPVLSFGLPILDVALAVSRRFLRGRPLFSADADHIHHKLLKRGLSQRNAVVTLYAVTASFAFLSLVVLHDATMIALVLAVIGLGIAVGVQYLGYEEFTELRRFLQRAALRKRAMANNVEVRHAIEALDSCIDADRFCKILESALQPIGFGGCRINCPHSEAFTSAASVPFQLTRENEIQLVWDDARNSGSEWALRLDLTSENRRRLGHCTLLSNGSDSLLLVDVNILISDFRKALSDAVIRITNTSQLHVVDQPKMVHVKAASASE